MWAQNHINTWTKIEIDIASLKVGLEKFKVHKVQISVGVGFILGMLHKNQRHFRAYAGIYGF